jgi:hypothetical protein
MQISAIGLREAAEYFEKHSAYRGQFSLAIAAQSEDGMVHGVIAMVTPGGETCSLGHISTDGNAQVGSLLYGAAWRAAKALGYKSIQI